MIFKTCPNCGANLDPSETCDCQEEENNKEEKKDGCNNKN